WSMNCPERARAIAMGAAHRMNRFHCLSPEGALAYFLMHLYHLKPCLADALAGLVSYYIVFIGLRPMLLLLALQARLLGLFF
ncbi:hypothetical protein, partial [Marinifilum sp. D737]|uniref:hypothetical protein n=1 Tax=Marinifilum sp. D737 TaxID=2969628 RepID=UPI0022727409